MGGGGQAQNLSGGTLYEGRPNLLDLITNGEVDLIINSPVGDESEYKPIIRHFVPCDRFFLK